MEAREGVGSMIGVLIVFFAISLTAFGVVEVFREEDDVCIKQQVHEIEEDCSRDNGQKQILGNSVSSGKCGDCKTEKE
jgi:hypothetical protein